MSVATYTTLVDRFRTWDGPSFYQQLSSSEIVCWLKTLLHGSTIEN